MKDSSQKIVPISFNETRPQEMKLLDRMNKFCEENAINRSGIAKMALKDYLDKIEKSREVTTQ